MTDHATAATHYIAQEEHAKDLAKLDRALEVNAELVAAIEAFVLYDDSDEDSSIDLMLAYDDAITKARAALAKAEASK